MSPRPLFSFSVVFNPVEARIQGPAGEPPLRGVVSLTGPTPSMCLPLIYHVHSGEWGGARARGQSCLLRGYSHWVCR